MVLFICRLSSILVVISYTKVATNIGVNEVLNKC